MNLENIHLLPLPFITREETYRTKINFLMFPKRIINFHQYMNRPDLKRKFLANTNLGAPNLAEWRIPEKVMQSAVQTLYLRSVGPPTQKL